MLNPLLVVPLIGGLVLEAGTGSEGRQGGEGRRCELAAQPNRSVEPDPQLDLPDPHLALTILLVLGPAPQALA